MPTPSAGRKRDRGCEHNAILTQAANHAAPSRSLIAQVVNSLTGLQRLAFDRLDNPYKAVTGSRATSSSPTRPRPAFPIASASYLTLLTLDVMTNLPNCPTEVDICWWNESNAVSPTSPLYD